MRRVERNKRWRKGDVITVIYSYLRPVFARHFSPDDCTVQSSSYTYHEWQQSWSEQHPGSAFNCKNAITHKHIASSSRVHAHQVQRNVGSQGRRLKKSKYERVEWMNEEGTWFTPGGAGIIRRWTANCRLMLPNCSPPHALKLVYVVRPHHHRLVPVRDVHLHLIAAVRYQSRLSAATRGDLVAWFHTYAARYVLNAFVMNAGSRFKSRMYNSPKSI